MCIFQGLELPKILLSMLRIVTFAVFFLDSLGSQDILYKQRKLWSDCLDVHAELRFCWQQRS